MKRNILFFAIMGIAAYYLATKLLFKKVTGSKNAAFDISRLTASATAKKNGYTEQYNPPFEVIQNLRKLWDILQHFSAYTFNSVYRCKRLNTAVGGKSNSSHLRGLAVDISTRGLSESQIDRLVQDLIAKGFFRIGLGKTLIHADIDKSLPYPAVFLYEGKHKTPLFLEKKKTLYLQLIKNNLKK